MAVDNGDGKEMIFYASIPPISPNEIDVHHFARMCVAMRLTGMTDTQLKSARMDTTLAADMVAKG